MSPRRILAIQLKRLGDLVLAQPALVAIREAWPESRLTLLTESPFHDALAGADGPHEIHVHLPGVLASFNFGRDLATHRYDMVFDFQGSPTSARLTWQTRAAVRVGWDRRSRRPAYTMAVPRPAADPPRYTADQKLDLLRALRIDPVLRAPRIRLHDEEREAMVEALARGGLTPGQPTLVVLPASRRAYKRWPVESYAGTIRLFLNAEPAARVIVTGGPGEEEVVEEVARRAGSGQILALPLRSIRQMMAVLDRADLVFCHDGGPKHLAQALGRATFALFGPQQPAVWTPPGDSRHAVRRARREDCREHCSKREGPCECLAGLPADDVAADLLAHWSRVRTGDDLAGGAS